MTRRAAAARYARALFDVVVKNKKGDPARAEREVAAFADLFASVEPLARVAANPAVPAPRKRAVVAALVERMKPSVEVGKLLLLLAERDRLALLPELVEAYRQRLFDYQGIVRAEVTTPVAMDEKRRASLEARLASATGRKVLLASRVDPSIIGGAVARVGSVVYDGSIARQLQKLRETLAEA